MRPFQAGRHCACCQLCRAGGNAHTLGSHLPFQGPRHSHGPAHAQGEHLPWALLAWGVTPRAGRCGPCSARSRGEALREAHLCPLPGLHLRGTQPPVQRHREPPRDPRSQNPPGLRLPVPGLRMAAGSAQVSLGTGGHRCEGTRRPGPARCLTQPPRKRAAPSTNSGPGGVTSFSGPSSLLQKKATSLAASRNMAAPPASAASARRCPHEARACASGPPPSTNRAAAAL